MFKGDTMVKIKTAKDVKSISDKIVEQLVKGNLTYFNIVVAEDSSFSNCFFTPTTEIEGKQKRMIFVGDYEKILYMLLSHPKISDIDYNPSKKMVSAVFENPYEESEEEDF